MSTTLADIEILAVTKAVAAKFAKTAREGVEPGEYNVSFDAHVEGTVRIGNDYEQKIVNKAQPWAIIAALLQENERLSQAAGSVGINLDKIVAMAEAVDPASVKEAQKKAESVAAGLKAATLSPCKGKVTADLSVTPLAD